MIDYAEYLRTVIQRGTFVLSEMEDKINKLWVEGKLTDADREVLLPMAAEYADDRFQVNVMEQLADLELRVYNLEHPVDQFPIWQKGQVSVKGQPYRFDVTGDGELDLVRYDGGRASTSLSIGKIEGWHMLDRELNPTHTITRDADGGYIVTPIPEPEPEPEPETPSDATDGEDGTNTQGDEEIPSESSTELESMTKVQLLDYANEQGIEVSQSWTNAEIIAAIMEAA